MLRQHHLKKRFWSDCISLYRLICRLVSIDETANGVHISSIIMASLELVTLIRLRTSWRKIIILLTYILASYIVARLIFQSFEFFRGVKILNVICCSLVDFYEVTKLSLFKKPCTLCYYLLSWADFIISSFHHFTVYSYYQTLYLRACKYWLDFLWWVSELIDQVITPPYPSEQRYIALHNHNRPVFEGMMSWTALTWYIRMKKAF